MTDVNMSFLFSYLIEQYKTCIIQDKIINYDNFNFDIITKHIDAFKEFLDEHIQYNNNTYIYFRCIYYYCKGDYITILELANNIEENNIYNLLGYYYKNIEKNYDLMKKYYLKAIEMNNANAMHNFGDYYHNIEINPDLMKKYYLMAIELGNKYAMNNLSLYYEKVEKNYDLMKIYYLMAIPQMRGINDADAMCNLGYYYQFIKINYELMKKYYIIAIELGGATAMNYLGYYYQYIEKNYDLMKKYYLMAINKESNLAYNNLYDFYKQKNYMIEFYRLLQKECNNSTFIKNKLITFEKIYGY